MRIVSLWLCTLIFLAFGIGKAAAQICAGQLGDNIFTQGDFGTGTPNIYPLNPGIAPGYIYSTTPPPNDGDYTLTNDIGAWASNFGWLIPTDNSPDPNGYMMVVNASYDPGLFYEKRVDGLCENTLYTFSADILNLIRAGGNLIRPNVSFLIDGAIVFNSGNVPENEQWNTYGFNFTTGPSQTSVTLALANNAPGGNGNDIALDNISFRPCGPLALVLPDQPLNLCEDGLPVDLTANLLGNQYSTPQIQWQRSNDFGITWTDIPGATGPVFTHSNLFSGTYYYRYLVANTTGNLSNAKCRVTSTVKVVQVIPKEYIIRDTICSGLSYEVGTSQYMASGSYIDSLSSVTGCDSIVLLDLEVVPDRGLMADIWGVDPSCDYKEDGQISWGNVQNGVGPFTLFLNGRPRVADSLLSDLAAGLYLFGLVDRYGCQLDTVLELVAPPPFVIDLGPDQEAILGDSIELLPTGSEPIVLYNWIPNERIDCEVGCSPVMWLPPGSGLLTLVATSPAGCEARDSMRVVTTPVRSVFFPNAFTPNGDGLNDVFFVKGDYPAALEVTRLQIFDRWGKLVFFGENLPLNNPDGGWDGRAGGRATPEGVYAYSVEVLFLDGFIFRRAGTVTLYR